MTLPDEPVDTEAPVDDVLDQRRTVGDLPGGGTAEPPIEADPVDVADQQAVVDLDDPYDG